jgi:hypothetical protein
MASANRIEAADHFPRPDYSNWLRFAIDSFLEADKADDMIEAYEIQRGVNTLTRVMNIVGKHGHLAVLSPVRDRVTFQASTGRTKGELKAEGTSANVLPCGNAPRGY